MEMIYKNKTGLLIKGLFDVQNEVGLGHAEEAYHQAYKVWLEEHNIPFTSKAPHELTVNGDIAYILFPDFVVWGCITIELKAVARQLRNEELVQLFDYLKYRGDRLGLLVNMGLDRVFVKRIIHENTQSEVCENIIAGNNEIAGDVMEIINKTRQSIKTVFEQHGTRYGRKITEKLICCSLHNIGLQFETAPIGSAYYHDKLINKSHLDCIIINRKLVLVFTALFDDNKFNISRGLSFMKTLELKCGLAVNFGKITLEITDLYHSQ